MDKITRPPQLSGTTQEQISQIWDYLAKMNDELNSRLDGIGSNELTDDERETMRPLMGAEMKSGRMISMKDMIIKTAEASRKEIREAKDKANAAMAICKAFVEAKTVGTGVNLNDLTEQGTYYFPTSAAESATNAPTSGWFSLIVISRRYDNDVVNQFAFANGNIYNRDNGSTGPWSSWRQYV